MSISFTPRRRRCRVVAVGTVKLGGKHPIAVQSMTNTPTHDVKRTVAQIKRLVKAGCEIVRCTVPDDRAAAALPQIIARIDVPLVADIHFRADLAVKALEAGAAKVRINPGNLGGTAKLDAILDAAGERGAAIRIGVNSGSLEKILLAKHGHPTPAALAESMAGHVEYCETRGFRNLVLSIKSTALHDAVEATRLIARTTRYPLHIGITEAGTAAYGSIKSAAGLGILLYQGIGDTLRVSLSGDPVQEIGVARNILRSVRARLFGPEVITCPTCGRTKMAVEKIALQVEKAVRDMTSPITIAVMGCEVNGPGEAAEADIGLACGAKQAALFVKGKKLHTVKADKAVNELLKEIGKRWK